MREVAYGHRRAIGRVSHSRPVAVTGDRLWSNRRMYFNVLCLHFPLLI